MALSTGVASILRSSVSFPETADVIRGLVRFTDWWQPQTGSILQVAGARRSGGFGDGIPDGLLDTIDERAELSRRVRDRLDDIDRRLLYLWYVRELPVNEIGKRVHLSRRTCFRRRSPRCGPSWMLPSLRTTRSASRIAHRKAPLLKGTAVLRRQILARSAHIAVIGQGYVGLSLACAAAEAGFTVTGHRRRRAIASTACAPGAVVAGVAERFFRAAFDAGGSISRRRWRWSPRADLVFICVPTPLLEGTPDLSFIDGACVEVATRMVAGSLVVLESTTYPGHDRRARQAAARGLRPGGRPRLPVGVLARADRSGQLGVHLPPGPPGRRRHLLPRRPAWRTSSTSSSWTR